MSREVSPRQLYQRREAIIINRAEKGFFSSEVHPEIDADESRRKTDNMGLAYTLSDTSAASIARGYNITPAAVRGRSDKFLRFVWRHAPPMQKKGLTLRGFIRDKIQYAEKMSAGKSGNGVVRAVRLSHEQGAITIEELVRSTGHPRQRVLEAATILNRLGYSIDRKKIQKYEDIFRRLETETDDKKIQELLDRIPGFIAVIYCRRQYSISDRQADPLSRIGPFISLGEAVRRKYTYKTNTTSKIMEIVSKKNIPFKKAVKSLSDPSKPSLVYYIFLRRHADRILEAFDDPRIREMVFAH